MVVGKPLPLEALSGFWRRTEGFSPRLGAFRHSISIQWTSKERPVLERLQWGIFRGEVEKQDGDREVPSAPQLYEQETRGGAIR